MIESLLIFAKICLIIYLLGLVYLVYYKVHSRIILRRLYRTLGR